MNAQRYRLRSNMHYTMNVWRMLRLVYPILLWRNGNANWKKKPSEWPQRTWTCIFFKIYHFPCWFDQRKCLFQSEFRQKLKPQTNRCSSPTMNGTNGNWLISKNHHNVEARVKCGKWKTPSQIILSSSSSSEGIEVDEHSVPDRRPETSNPIDYSS